MDANNKIPKKIYVQQNDDDIAYIRADTYHACLEAGCSLHYHLFKIADALKNNSATFDEFEAMLADAQPALDAWNRFLDGKEE